jgi:multidrug transporter EmrE-like cation transporter
MRGGVAAECREPRAERSVAMAESYVAGATENLRSVAAESEPRTSRAVSGWSFAHRVAFRFVFSYLVLYIFPFPLGSYPGSIYPIAAYDKIWYALVPWVGKHILHLRNAITVFPNGSGDTTFNYVQILCMVIIAAAATIIWTALDRKRMEYRTLHEWLRIYVRYALAFTMLAYGMDKVIKLQFQTPGLERLAEPFGNYSPFALLWTFMGFSTPYTHFAGWCEVTGAVLLFFRRTTTLGALILCGVIANVAALNYFYDVPVKIFSTSLLLMAIFLAAPDWRRVANLFLLNRPAAPASSTFPLHGRRIGIARVVLKTLALMFAAYWFIFPESLDRRTAMRKNIARPPIYGLYQVESFTQNGKPVAWNDRDWRRMIFEYRQRVSVISTDDTISYYSTKYDAAKNSVTLTGEESKKPDGVLVYSQSDAEHLELRGDFKSQPVTIELRKIDASKFELMSRGFHWINEHPHYE